MPVLHEGPEASHLAAISFHHTGHSVFLSVKDLVKKVHSLVREDSIWSLIQGYDLALTDFAKIFLAELALSPTQQHALEYRTRDQSSNPLWHAFRWGRLTASRFGAIIRRVKPAGPLVKSLLYDSVPETLPSLKWGREHEDDARKCYEAQQGCKVACRGLVVDKCGYLGCSPDGVVFHHDEEGLLEIKCPYSARNMDLEEACLVVENFCCFLDADGRPCLSKNHDYYYQIQGSMAILRVKYCDFVVWTLKDMSIERITFDEQLWNAVMLPRLEKFYFSYLLPEILLPNYPGSEIVERSLYL